MPNKPEQYTRSAVEATLLDGLSDTVVCSQQQDVLPESHSELPDNRWKSRVKLRLKKSKLIYGCWLRYKAIRVHWGSCASFNTFVKFQLKKFRLVRFLINKKKEPGLIKADHEMLIQLMQIVTSISQKCDAMGLTMNRLTEDIPSLIDRTASVGSEKYAQQVVSIEKQLDMQYPQIEQLLSSLQEQNNGLSSSLVQLYQRLQQDNADAQNLLATTLQQLNHVEEDRCTASLNILTSVSENLDVLTNITQNVAAKQRGFHTVSGSDAICLQYDWDILLAVPNSDWRLAMYLSVGGHFEYGTEKLFRDLVHEGMVVLDIGANVGIYTLHALMKKAEVYAFEPTPSTFEILRQNVCLNGFEFSNKAHLFNYAASNLSGTASFQIVDHTCGHNSMFAQEEASRQIEVKTDRIDHLVGNIRVDIFKIDVEGAEMIALQGMETLLELGDDMIGILEFAPGNLRQAGVHPSELYEKLIACGFHSIQIINESNGSLSPVATFAEIEHVDSVNLLLKKRS